MLILLKALGKCTTDHISPAGPWLKYRGHLPNISGNMFSGAVSASGSEAGRGLNILSGEGGKPYAEIARYYKSRGHDWVVIGDENYGEGSSREHAAMSPRYLGCRAVIVRSFARIHETNLKKQGILPLTFVDPADYELIAETYRVSILGLRELKPGSELILRLTQNGASRDLAVKHSFTGEQLEWFKAGSALNTLRPK